jgi:hypothetical protein
LTASRQHLRRAALEEDFGDPPVLACFASPVPPEAHLTPQLDLEYCPDSYPSSFLRAVSSGYLRRPAILVYAGVVVDCRVLKC